MTGVTQRLYRYPGCLGYVRRWFTPNDPAQAPYRTEAEARAVLAAREAHNNKRSAS